MLSRRARYRWLLREPQRATSHRLLTSRPIDVRRTIQLTKPNPSSHRIHKLKLSNPDPNMNFPPISSTWHDHCCRLVLTECAAPPLTTRLFLPTANSATGEYIESHTAFFDTSCPRYCVSTALKFYLEGLPVYFRHLCGRN